MHTCELHHDLFHAFDWCHNAEQIPAKGYQTEVGLDLGEA